MLTAGCNDFMKQTYNDIQTAATLKCSFDFPLEMYDQHKMFDILAYFIKTSTRNRI